MKISVGNKINFGFAAALLLILIIGFAAFLGISDLVGTSSDVLLSHRITTGLESISRGITKAESSYREFIITGDSLYLRRLNSETAGTKSQIFRLRKLLISDGQQARLNSIDSLCGSEFERMTSNAVIRDSVVKNPELLRSKLTEGIKASEHLEDMLNILTAHQMTVLQNRITAVSNKFNKAIIILIAGGLVACLVVLFSFIIIRKDLKRRNEAEREIRMLAKAVRSAKECIVITDINNKIIFVNEAFRKTYRAEDLDLRGKSVDIIQSDNNPGEMLNKILPMTLNGGWSGELNNKKLDGEEFPVHLSTSVVKNDDGKPIALIGISNDISEKRRTDDSIKDYIEELEISKEVLERNAEELVELNKQLFESEKQLKELNANKDKFFSIISHDLRSPFNSLLGLTNLLAEDIDELDIKDVKGITADINKASNNLLNLLDNLLEWSRLKTGRIEFEPTDENLHEIIFNIIYLLRGNALKKGINIVNNVSEDIIINADTNMIGSVFQNLISNAIKFTGEYGEIIVSADEKEGEILVSVSDNGVGISDKDIDKLFRIDVNHSTLGTAKEKGTGLGLILCKELVEKNGGKIWAESTKGKGSVFKFTLNSSIERNKTTSVEE